MGKKLYNSILIILDYIFVFCLIYFGRSIWHSIPTLSNIDRLMKFALVCSTIICIVLSGKKKIKISNYLILIGIIVLFCAFVIIRPYKKNIYIKTIGFAFAAIVYVFFRRDKYIEILGRYQSLIIFFSTVSLLLWLLGSLLNIVQPSGYVYSTWTGTDEPKYVATYFYIYFEPQTMDLFSYKGIIRNCSIFAEAPMFNLHLCLSFVYELFLRKKLSIWKACVLIICIITTFSTTGYVVIAAAIAIKYIITGKNKKTVKIIKIFTIPVVGILAIYLLVNLISNKMGSFSGNTRIDDFAAGFRAWKDNILFGNGYENMDAIKHYMSAFRANDMGYSNSPMQILAFGGLYMFIPYFATLFIGIIRNFHDRNKLSYCLFFLYLWTVTIIPFIPLTACFIVGMLFLYKNKEDTDRSSTLNIYENR